MVSRQTTDHLSQMIYDDLRHKIVSGELPVGTRLPTERELAVNYRAARNTVRKTMTRLSNEGFVERQVGRGSFVTSPGSDPANTHTQSIFPLNELLEARLLFEPAIVELVLERASDEDLATLDGKLDALRKASTWEQFKEAKYGLHLAIVKLSRNTFLVHVFEEIISTRRAVAWQRSGPTVPLSLAHDAANAENAAIVAALRARDGKKAHELIKSHLLNVFVSLSGQ